MDVSVVCPVFNTSPDVLAGAIRSVLSQAGPHEIELILVDDCSTDPATTAALCEAADGDRRVQVINQDSNSGPARARSVGVARARHDWVSFIDSDDLWPDGKLNQAATVLEEWPDSRWIGGSFATLLPDGSLRAAQRLTVKCSPAQRR